MAKDKPRFGKTPAPTQTGPRPTRGLTTDAKPPQSDDPVEMASEMSFPASDPPASRRPRGADAGLPHDALATHAEDGQDAGTPGRVEGQDPSVQRPTEPPPT
jgi:hypothetical protein